MVVLERLLTARLSLSMGGRDDVGNRRSAAGREEVHGPTVTLVNCFEIPAGREDEFFGLWQQVNAYMQSKPGYLRHKLHRSLAPDARSRFVNVAERASAQDFQAAHDEGFRALVNQPSWAEFHHFPALYEVIHEGQAGGIKA